MSSKPRKITISKFHLKIGYWGAKISEKYVKQEGHRDGYHYIILHRNYFPDTHNGNALRFQNIQSTHASYKDPGELYVEVLPDVFVYVLPVHSENLEENISRAVTSVGKIPACSLEKFKDELLMLN